MKWAWIKQFPKFVLVVAVLVLSTGLFGLWWFTRGAKRPTGNRSAPLLEDIGPKLALIESKPGHLLLIDNDLYDIDTGAVIFRNWLKEGPPLAIYYDDHSKKIMARYERGFVRYALDGKPEATLGQKTPPLFSADLKSILFVKDKDIWRAEVNWPEMKFENERKITSIEQFFEQNFASNVILRTEKTLVVRNLSNILRVNLEIGDVKPLRMRLGDIGKRRSPDSKWVVGIDGSQFYCYDVDSDTAKTLPIGRGGISDFQWLGNDKCAAIASGKTVVIYDRQTGVLSDVAALPSPCNRITDPSPDNRLVFCVGNRAGFLVDLGAKKVQPVTGGGGISWLNDETFAFSRETPNSDLRGMWLQTVGQPERRISPEPYVIGHGGGAIMRMKDLDLIVFITNHGLVKMKPDGTGVLELGKIEHPPSRFMEIHNWSSTN